MKHLVLVTLICLGAGAGPMLAWQPFGVDVEATYDPLCNPGYGSCPLLDQAAAAGAQWVRLLAVWNNLEPSNGSFTWGNLPYDVWYAQQKGMNVILTATWAPQWANGAISTCPPYAGATQTGPGSSNLPQCANGYQDVGRTVTNSSYTYNFFYNLALQFNGNGQTSGCNVNPVNASLCHPLVQYYGVWNEPNGMNNFNDTYYDPNNLGNYLNDFVNQYLSPAHSAVHAANAAALLMAADLGTGGNTCGGFQGNNCGTWQASWMQPLNQYFTSYYDVITIHGYNGSENTLKGNVDQVENSYNSGRKQIWVDENAMSGTSNVTQYYVDEYNRQSYWQAAFWEFGGYGVSCSTTVDLICSPGSGQLQGTAYFTAYQQVYAPH